MCETLEFDDSNHQYRLGNRILPSVTKILSELRIGHDYTGIDPFYAKRGVAVHKAVELLDKGTLDDSSVVRDIRVYVDAYRRFVAETKYKPVRWEIRLASKRLGYAGGIDKVGEIDGRLGIIDVKTSQSVDHVSLKAQLIGYKVLWEENFPNTPIDFLYGLQLRRDGRPNLITKHSDTPKSHWIEILDRYLLLTL